MSKRRGLSSVPDAPESTTEFNPETEESHEGIETPARQGYTLAEQFTRNAQLIREQADALEIDPEALVTLFGITMNVHFTKIQLGLAAPVEG